MKVLVLEDDPFLQIDMTDMIGELGHEVVGPFAKVPKALAACEATPPDAAFLDFNLGDDGQKSCDVADFLIANNVPFAFTTGYSRSHLPDRYGDSHLIEKPFGPKDLEDFLGNAVNGGS